MKKCAHKNHLIFSFFVYWKSFKRDNSKTFLIKQLKLCRFSKSNTLFRMVRVSWRSISSRFETPQLELHKFKTHTLNLKSSLDLLEVVRQTVTETEKFPFPLQKSFKISAFRSVGLSDFPFKFPSKKTENSKFSVSVLTETSVIPGIRNLSKMLPTPKSGIWKNPGI